MEQTGSIYIIKNTVNDKVYIGQTTMTVQERFKQHMKPSTCKQRRTYKLYNAINKYGSDKFYYEILETDIPVSLLDEAEIDYIDRYDSFKNGYNSTNGGNTKRLYKYSDIGKMVQMLNEGKTFQEIATEFSINKGTVSRILHGMGIYAHDKINEEELIELFNQGLSNAEITDKLGSKEWTIDRRLKNLGLRRKKVYIQYRTDIDYDKIKKDFESGMYVKDICKKHNLDEKTYHKIKNNGFQALYKS